MPSYKLTYFDLYGRAELARLMFAAAKVEFEDDRFQREEWPKRKAEQPFGQVPVLYIDGKPLPQSGAINRYLATEFGFNGSSSIEAAYIEMIYAQIEDVFRNIPFMEPDEKIKKEKTEAAYKDIIMPTLEKMEKKFSEANRDYLVGNKLSYADITMYTAFWMMEKHGQSTSNFKCLSSVVDRVKQTDGIKQYLAARPDRPI